METYDWKKVTAALLTALAIGLLVSMGVAMGFAALIAGEMLSENSVGYGSMIAVFLGALVSAILGARKMPFPRLPSLLGSGLVFWLGLMLVGLLFFGRLQGGLLVTGGLCLGGGLLVGLLTPKGSGKPKYKVPKLRF